MRKPKKGRLPKTHPNPTRTSHEGRVTSTPSDIKALNVALDALCPASILKLTIQGGKSGLALSSRESELTQQSAQIRTIRSAMWYLWYRKLSRGAARTEFQALYLTSHKVRISNASLNCLKPFVSYFSASLRSTVNKKAVKSFLS